MDIKTTNLMYNFDDTTDGGTKSISVGFSGQEGSQYFNSTMEVTKDNLAEGKTFDDLTKKEIVNLARINLAAITSVDNVTKNA